MGEKAIAEAKSSMAINLQGASNTITTTKEGQFLVQAKTYRFQLTNKPGDNNENIFEINKNNVGNLQDAIDAESGRRRELRTKVNEHRRQLDERRRRRME